MTPPSADRRAEERGLRAYRLFLRLYPRRFRQEYGDDLLLLLRDQLAAEPAARVYARAAMDLALTVPSRHLEARTKRPPFVLVPMIFTLVALGWFMMLGVGGSSVVVSLAFALPGLAAAVLAAVSWRPPARWGATVPGGGGSSSWPASAFSAAWRWSPPLPATPLVALRERAGRVPYAVGRLPALIAQRIEHLTTEHLRLGATWTMGVAAERGGWRPPPFSTPRCLYLW